MGKNVVPATLKLVMKRNFYLKTNMKHEVHFHLDIYMFIKYSLSTEHLTSNEILINGRTEQRKSG